MAFTGRAIYGTGIFDGVQEDVADMIGIISPYETPLLDRIGDPPRPATNVLHEWLEDQLNPNTLVTSNIIDATGTSEDIGVVDDAGGVVTPYIQVGVILKAKTTGEYFQVTAISGNTVTVSRAFGGTSAATLTAGSELLLVSDAALEGADVSVDTSRPRARRSNYCQIFKKDLIISGTVQAVTQLGGVSDELEYQKQQRTREIIRDLEKAVINGKSSGNSIGSATAYRTMKGVWDHLTTNSYSVATINESWLNTVLEAAWSQGAGDIDLIIADSKWKRVIDNWNNSRIQVVQGTATNETYRSRVTYFQSTFGDTEVILGRWMPQYSLMCLSTQRVRVVPLQGRSFRYEPVARTGDAEKGMIIGEYTVEVWNEKGMSKAYGTS